MGRHGIMTTIDPEQGVVVTSGGDMSPLRYEIVTSIPDGYEIWVIGSYAPEGFVALCRPVTEDSHRVDLGALCAIPSEHAGDIMEASLYAVTPDEADRLLGMGRDEAIRKWRNIDDSNADRAISVVRRALEPMRDLFRQ